MRLCSWYPLGLLPFGLIAGAFFSQANASDFYGSAGFQQNRIQISNSTFDLYGPTMRVGKWISKGIALEFGATIPATDDRQNEVTIEMDSLLSAGIRLESPTARNQATAAYVVGGIASADITGATVGAVQSSSNYTGTFIEIGILHSVGRRSQLALDFAYYKVDQSIRIPSVHIGFRHSF